MIGGRAGVRQSKTSRFLASGLVLGAVICRTHYRNYNGVG